MAIPHNDWTVQEAEKLAAICKRHGLRARVVVCRKTDSYCAIYHDSSLSDAAFREKHKAVRVEAAQANWDGFEKIIKAGP